MTKKYISDGVLYKLYGGVPDAGGPVQERDVWAAIDRKTNSIFKLSQFNINLPNGGTIPDNLNLATYENISVTRTSNSRSKVTLPVTPISLPLNMGINEIRPVLSTSSSSDRTLGQPFIPLQAGQDFLLSADKLLNDLMGQIGYTVNGKTIYFTKDITTFGIDTVDMKLVVFDISQYGLTDDLPIPSDYIDQIQTELLAEFAPIMAESGYVNNFTNAGQNANTVTK